MPSARIVSAQIVNGLEHIHSHGIVYSDLKPESMPEQWQATKSLDVLIMQNGSILLTDFGSARYEDEIKAGDRIEGTVEYLAPEVLIAL